jgi:hypothetical protein
MCCEGKMNDCLKDDNCCKDKECCKEEKGEKKVDVCAACGTNPCSCEITVETEVTTNEEEEQQEE